MGFLGFNFKLMDQLVFYGTYHQAKGNQLIHFVFVPLIMWSAGVWLAYIGPVSDAVDVPAHLDFLPPFIAKAYVCNWAFVALTLYSLYYICLEPFAGLTWTTLLAIPMLGLCNAFQQYVPFAWAFAIFVHLLGWYMQVHVGHILIEGKRPALMDSFFQSLVLAGLFAWMEGLFALGYRPRLQDELHRRISIATEEDEKRRALLADDGSAKLPISHSS